VGASGASWGTAANWSATSGGAGGAGVPTSSDNAIFDQAGTYSVAYFGTYDCLSLSVTAGTVSFTVASGSPTSVLNIYGSLSLVAGTTVGSGFAIQLNFVSTSTGNTISATGSTIRTCVFSGAGGEWTLLGNVTTTSPILLTAGTLKVGGYTFKCGDFNSTGTTARELDMGGGTVEMTSGTSTVSGSNFTLSNGGTFLFTGSSAKTFEGNGVVNYPTFNQSGTGTLTITGNNTFSTFTSNVTLAGGATTINFDGGSANTFGAFTVTGTSTRRVTLGSTTTTQARLTKPGAWYVGANSTDNGNNSGLAFAAGGGIDYLNISYIRGVDSSGTGNFLAFF
jgi:hypothetical protein